VLNVGAKMSTVSNDDSHEQGGGIGKWTGGAERRVQIINNCLDSRDLFVGTREIVILHGNDKYHLRLTGQNKLILTK
jgi:hemin uptake protein HemP